MIFPIGSRSSYFNKWPSNWRGLYSIQGTSLPRALNGKYLKSIILAFGKTLELKMVDNNIIAFSTKNGLK
jgi:hypothetical protein